MHGDMPRTSVVDDRDPVISTRSIVKHELAMAPNHIPTLLRCDWVDGDLGGLLDLVGNRLLDFRLTFQCTENTATKERILRVGLRILRARRCCRRSAILIPDLEEQSSRRRRKPVT